MIYIENNLDLFCSIYVGNSKDFKWNRYKADQLFVYRLIQL